MTLAVEFRGLYKAFYGTFANEDISLKVKKGSIHAIVGENGAGKSTAMKLLYGTYEPDAGDVFIDGQLWGGRMKPWSSPSDAIECGIGMVHQHFMLSGPHSVLDNILLGVEPSASLWKWLPKGFRPINRKRAREKLESLSAQYGLRVDWDTSVESLPVGVQQRIEILKLLYRDARILILDEPTAVLTPMETAELFAQLKKLAKQGKTILIVTHKLKEVMSLADRVSVFRAGHIVGHREIAETSMEDLACLMVGRKVSLRQSAPPPVKQGKVLLELKGLSFQSDRCIQDINVRLHAGEIVGISGVEGNGQSELLQVLLHPREYSHRVKGTMRLLGKNIRNLSTGEIKNLGVGVILEDRHRDALLLDRPVRENFLLGLQRREPFYQMGLLADGQLEEATWDILHEYDIRPRSTHIPVRALSGGNQQKLVIGRELKYSPKVLIAAQPTRGVDVGAIEFIHQRILKARSDGNGVLLVSSELDEVLSLSDRILVMYEGNIVAEFNRGEVTEKILGLHMGGAVQP